MQESLNYATFRENNMKNGQEMAERCFVLMQREKSTRTDPDPHQVLQDDVQQRLKTLNIHFEHILDAVPVYEANIMQRNRFTRWFGNGNGLISYPEDWASLQEPSDWNRIYDLSKFYDRYQYLKLWSPNSSAMRWTEHQRAREGDLFMAYLLCDRLSEMGSIITTQTEPMKHHNAVPDDWVILNGDGPFPNWYTFHGNQGIPPLPQTGFTHEKLRHWGEQEGTMKWKDFWVQHFVLAEGDERPVESEVKREADRYGPPGLDSNK